MNSKYPLRLLIVFYFLTSSFFLFSQKSKTNISVTDSLEIKLQSTIETSVKINILNKLFEYYLDSIPSKALQYAQQALLLAKDSHNPKLIATSLSCNGKFYYNHSNYTLSRDFHLQALKIFKEIQDSLKIVNEQYNIGLTYMSEGDYQNALSYTLQSLKFAEKIHDKKMESFAFNTIAEIYYYKNELDKGIEFLKKALIIAKETGDKNLEGNYLNNIGAFYQMKKDYQKAIQYFLQAYQICLELGNKNHIASALSNIGVVYLEKGDLNLAMKYFKEALNIHIETDDKSSQITCFFNIGEVYTEKKEFDKAIDYFNRSYKIATNTGEKESIKSAYYHYAKAYAGMKNYQKAYEYQQLYSDLKDTLLNEANNKQLVEMQTIYETEKKDNEIQLLNKDNLLKEESMKKQKIIIYTFIIGFIIILVFSIMLYKEYNAKKKANKILAEQKKIILEKNEELNQQNEEIAAQRDEIETQRDTVINQKEHIEQIHEELTDSIVYAQRIQQALLPMDDYLNEFLQEYFIFSKPKDIVSGDFFWITKVNSWTLFCVADCTGHGVPGAFMSMLGIALLNEIVRQEQITKASQILDYLRKRIIEALNQKGIRGEQMDGMDIAFCALNTETLEMQFAGANNPCYVIARTQSVIAMAQPEAISTAQSDCFVPRNDDCQLTEPVIELVEIKGDKQPIGIHSNMQPFTNQIYQLQKGDIIYLMSDGFEDQFGGPKHKKFLSRNMKNLLTANCQLPIADQKLVLEKTLSDWIRGYDQTDDITIIGIRV